MISVEGHRRKFRSQTSDNMDRWKAEQGRGREKKKIRRKEDGDARKGRKIAKHCVFPMIWGSGGSKSRLAKAAGAGCGASWPDERWKSARRCGAKHISKSKCTKHIKTLGVRTTFGSWDVEKVHAVVARSTFPSQSQNVQNTRGADHFWQLRCRKSARRCGAKHMSKSKCTKHTRFGPLLEVAMSKKCTPLWREAHFEVKSVKNWRVRTTFGGSDVVSRGRRRGLCTLAKVSKTWGFCGISKNAGRRGGHWKKILKDAFRVAGAVQKTYSSEMLGGQGADFLRRVAFWSIRSSGLLRWFCVTGAARRMTWHQFFVAGAILYTGGVERSQNALVRVCQLCTQLSIFEGSLTEFFVFDGLHFEKWGSLAELLRFGCCQVQKKEDVSQNCSVLDVLMFKHYGNLAEFLRFWSCR